MRFVPVKPLLWLLDLLFLALFITIMLLVLVAATAGAVCGLAVRLFTLPTRLWEAWRG